uniref:Uncharacterized protein n=1 Tax=Ananas comosus var. bracteatus TaxID=296719 RepID=A0A6V7Q9N9_ANACO|nr:unnamed protein product [Ananas comosus var. bracteatus]
MLMARARTARLQGLSSDVTEKELIRRKVEEAYVTGKELMRRKAEEADVTGKKLMKRKAEEADVMRKANDRNDWRVEILRRGDYGAATWQKIIRNNASETSLTSPGTCESEPDVDVRA